jgi:hypothetical protein
MSKRLLKILLASLLVLIVGFFVGYSAWNAANPEKTCANCHEINPSFETWQMSAHREINCLECHGSAMSNGFHSLKEKTGMIFTHVKKDMQNRDLRLTEDQIIETMDRCVKCHQEEYNKWQSGGHSATYADIFLNEEHNAKERPYWDCFRCHGMHYEGTIYDLLDPVSNKGPWKIKEKGKEDHPAITCLACHEVHTDNELHARMIGVADPKERFYERKEASQKRYPKAGLYVRADKIYMRADLLPKPEMFDGEREINISKNPLQNVCIQCHSPNFQHQAGSQDDHTLSGVHEGLACMACHETHSNDPTNSCSTCHPTISNCGQDHMTMNTTYRDPNSPNSIHHVKCIDCHEDGVKR